MTDLKPSAIERAKALIRAYKEQKQQEILKVAPVPTAQKPVERAKAHQEKLHNKYMDKIDKKLTPSLYEKE